MEEKEITYIPTKGGKWEAIYGAKREEFDTLNEAVEWGNKQMYGEESSKN